MKPANTASSLQRNYRPLSRPTGFECPRPISAGASVSRASGFCVWLSGLSGAGKSSIADVLSKRAADAGRQVTVLDGDKVRAGISRDLGFSREDRDANVLRIGAMASAAVHDGRLVICAVITPFESARAKVRAMMGENIALVYVDTPLALCEQRDVKGLYARARRGEITGFTGVDDPFEAPSNPDIWLKTTGSTPEESAETIVSYLVRINVLPRESV